MEHDRSNEGIAQPVNDEQSLELALSLVRSFWPGLSAEEQRKIALETAQSVKFLENERANQAALGQAVDEIFGENDG